MVEQDVWHTSAELGEKRKSSEPQIQTQSVHPFAAYPLAGSSGVHAEIIMFNPQQVQEEQLSAVVDWLTAQPRAAQLLDKDSSVVSTLEYHLTRYLKDVKRHYVKADKR